MQLMLINPNVKNALGLLLIPTLTMEHHFKIAGLDINVNNWNLVDDFNWLASGKPSPNWHIMKADEMKGDWV
jgi:hypothetical protein